MDVINLLIKNSFISFFESFPNDVTTDSIYALRPSLSKFTFPELHFIQESIKWDKAPQHPSAYGKDDEVEYVLSLFCIILGAKTRKEEIKELPPLKQEDTVEFTSYLEKQLTDEKSPVREKWVS